jgi:hypothetical protein
MNSPTSTVPKSSVAYYQSPPLVHTPSQMDPIHTLLSYFIKSHFHIILIPKPKLIISSFRFSDKKSTHIFHLSQARHISHLLNYEYTQEILIYTVLSATLAWIICKTLSINFQLKFVDINTFTVQIIHWQKHTHPLL